MESLKRYYLPIIAVVGWSMAYTAQINYDAWRFYSPSAINVSYNEYIEPQPLSATNTRLASFGATELAANLYWLQLIQYYGGGTPYGQYRKLPELFSTITDLSPRFKQAYITGLVVLPGEGFVDQALVLGQKGQENLPDDWELPYYTGLVNHIYKKDYVRAGELFEQAAKFENAPAITKLFAGIYFKEADQRRRAYLIFQTVAQTSQDDYVVERAERYLDHLDGLFLLENAVKKYRQQYKQNPNKLDDLIAAKILKKLPKSPLGLIYDYQSKTGKIIEREP